MKKLILILVAVLLLVAGSVWGQSTHMVNYVNNSTATKSGIIEDVFAFSQNANYGVETYTRCYHPYVGFWRIDLQKARYDPPANYDALPDDLVVDSAFLYLQGYSSYYLPEDMDWYRPLKPWNEGNRKGVAAGPHEGLTSRTWDYNSFDVNRRNWWWWEQGVSDIDNPDYLCADPDAEDNWAGHWEGYEVGEVGNCADSMWWVDSLNFNYEPIGWGDVDSITTQTGQITTTGNSLVGDFVAINADDPPAGWTASLTARVDLTELAQMWYDGTIGCNGIAGARPVAYTGVGAIYRSSNTSNSLQRPVFRLYYHIGGAEPDPEPTGNIKGVTITGTTINSTPPD